MDADTIVIGSSPISLMEALYLAQTGQKVLIVDNRSKPGGAWGEIDVHGQSVEIGCHIWDESSVAKRFLEKELQLPLTKLKPRPVVVWKGRKLPYHWKNNIILANTLFRHPSRIFRTLKKVRPALLVSDFYYPEKGSMQLVENLVGKLNSLDVRWLMNREVESLEVSEGLVTCKMGEEELSAKAGVVSLYTCPQRIKVDGKELANPNQPIDYSHYHLILEDQNASRLSYCRVYGHEYIHRISDIGAFGHTNKKVIAVGVFPHKLPNSDPEDHVDNIVAFAQKFGWISNNASIEAWGFNSYLTAKMGVDQFNALQKTPSMTVLNTMNFSHGIAAYAERWMR